MAHVTVHQLRSKNDGMSYLNVTESDGSVSVYTYLYNQPVRLCQAGNNVYLIVFDSKDYAAEFFEEHGNEFDKITKIEPVKG